MYRKLLLALALAGGLASPALAQSVVQDNLSGNETWSAGQGPGGPSSFITSNQVRGGTPTSVITVTGSAQFGVASGWGDFRWGGTLLLAAQPAAATFTLPPNPVTDGAIISICNTTAAAFATNVTTLAPASGQTLSGGNITLTTLAALTCVKVQFNRPTTTWYRVT